MNENNTELSTTLNYYPTKVRNSCGFLGYRPSAESFDICTLHDTCYTANEVYMMYHLDHINYPKNESSYYPPQYTRDLGYHVIAFNTPFGKNGRTVVRYRLYLLYLDESGDLRNHICTSRFLTEKQMLRHLNALHDTIMESTM